MLNALSSFSLKVKLFAMLFVLMSITLLVSSYTHYNNFYDVIEREQQSFTLEIISRVNEYLDFYTTIIQKNIFQSTVLDELDYGEAIQDEILQQLTRYFKQNIEFIDKIYYIDTDASMVTPNNMYGLPAGDVRNGPLYEQALRNPTKLFWSPINLSFQNDPIVTCYKAMLDSNGNTAGVLFVDIGILRINRMLSNIKIGQKGSVMLLDNGQNGSSANNGIILADYSAQISNVTEISPFILNEVNKYPQGKLDFRSRSGSRYFVFYSTVDKLNCKIVSIINQNVFQSSIDQLYRDLMFIWLTCLSITILVSFFISNYVSKPLKRFIKHIKKVSRGDLNVTITSDRKDEIGHLYVEFKKMSEQLQELVENLYITERGKKEMELQFLQAQINPHFLYNTLSAVNYLAMTNKNREIVTVVTSLINLYQSTIDNTNEYITIGEELQGLNHYIQIQQIRYGDKFTVKWDVHEGIRAFKILKLTLQPLVENAIFHGIQPLKGYGTVTIQADVVEDHIQFVVEDDGVGMAPETLNSLFNGTERAHNKGFNKIGLANVNERIQLNFGERYGLIVQSELGNGCKVIATIPIRYLTEREL